VGRFSWIFRAALVIGAGALLVTATVAAVAPRVWRIANAHSERPVELPEFQPLAQRTYVYDSSGNELAVFELENSQPVDLASVPSHVLDAFLAVEDSEFWSHRGVNVRSLFRATLSNFASDAPQQGASTITMQVVKNDFLAGLERDGRYKLLQISYAMRLEKVKTKEEILERYLNTVFFGNNAYGIAAASETYFGKEVAELTFVEAAFLAGLVRSPSGFDPISNPDRSRARFVQVLRRLVDDELLTEDESDQILDEFVIPERTRSLPSRAVGRTYFSEAVRDYLLNGSDILGETYQERYSRLFRGGLRIHTTLSPFLQSEAEAARNLLPDTPQRFDAALVSIETGSGAVRAMVGGRGFVTGQNELNLALAPSQTGSAIKIFILAAALQAGVQDDDVIDGTRGCRLPNPGNLEEPVFEITGGVEGGVFTMREQTYRSINCAFARLSQIVGLNRVVAMTYRMSESPYLYLGQPRSERAPIEPFASFATGANEMSTLDMAVGMQTIASGGIHHEPYYIEYIDDADGNRVYTHSTPGNRVLDEGVALTAVDIMKDTLTRGTGSAELSDFARKRPATGKTGTQQNNTTAFFVGSTQYLTTAVLVRDPDRYTPMDGIPQFAADGVRNGRVQGGTYPARIWGAFMERAHVFEPITDWEPPPPPERRAARLYLPGNECLYRTRVVATPTTVVTPSNDLGGTDQVTEQEETPGQEEPPPTTVPVDTVPPTTAPPVTVLEPIESGTTVPPDVLDPRAPVPSAPVDATVRPC
jgi:membrane peptidoglycan carboxypeptidase